MEANAPRSRIWLWALLLFVVIVVLAIFTALSPVPAHAPISTAPPKPKLAAPISADSADEKPTSVVTKAQPPVAESGVVAGTVLWFGTDDPARDVPVYAEAAGLPTLQTISDSDGGFMFDGVLKGVFYTLRAYGGDGGPFAFEERKFQIAAGALLDNQDLVVWPGMTVPGIVYQTGPNVDLLGGATISESDAEKIFEGNDPFKVLKRPFPGVHIRLTRRAPSTDPDLARADAPIKAVQANYEPVSSAPRREWEAVTDQAGRFAIPNVPSGRYDIEALAPPGVVALPPGEKHTRDDFLIWPGRPDGQLEFRFRIDGLSAEGRVVDAQNQPIEGAFVQATPRASEEGGTLDVVGTVETITDAIGHYTLEGLAGADVTAALQYVVGGTLRPQQAYTVTVTAEGFASRQMEFPALNAPLIEAGRTVLRVAARKGLANSDERGRQSKLPESHGRVIELPEIVLEAAASIEGRVVDTAGRTIGNALVRPWYSPRPKSAPLESFITNPEPFRTDVNGAFRMRSLSPGGYDFAVDDPETGVIEPQVNRPLRVKAGETLRNAEVVIQSKENRGAIRGRVIEARTNKPIEKFETHVRVREPALDERNPTPGNRSEDEMEPGHFLIRRISPGRVELQVKADGFPEYWTSLEIRAGHETEVVVALQEGAMVEGVVTRDGSPISGVYVSAKFVNKEIERTEIGGTSDTNGAYRVRNLAPAEYLMSMQYEVSPGVNRYQYVPVRLNAGERVHLDFNVTGGSRIEGTLTFSDAFERGLVYVKQGFRTGPMTVDGDVIQDPSGTVAFVNLWQPGPYTIDDIPPGDYTVIGLGARPKKITNGTTMRREYIETQTRISVRAGETARADLTIPSDR